MRVAASAAERRRGGGPAPAPASPASPCQAGRVTLSRSSPWAAISVVTVSASTQARRAGQTSAASVSATIRLAASIPLTIWPTGPRSGGDRIHQRRLGVRERRGDRPLGIERADDDRGRAARPRDVGEPADAGRPVGVGERRRRAGGEDDGGDGHWRLPCPSWSRQCSRMRRGTFPGAAGYCRVTPAARPLREKVSCPHRSASGPPCSGAAGRTCPSCSPRGPCSRAPCRCSRPGRCTRTR